MTDSTKALYKIVPVEPTEAMEDAFIRMGCGCPCCANASLKWGVMIAASPSDHGLVMVSREDLQRALDWKNLIGTMALINHWTPEDRSCLARLSAILQEVK